MFIFVLVFNFIFGLNIFSNVSAGLPTYGNISDFKTVTKSPQYTGGIVMDNLWVTILLGSLGGMAIAVLLQSTSILGIYIFCFTFWAAYGNLLSILSIGGYLLPVWGFVSIGTGIMLFIFIAAVIGMTTGSG